MNPETLIQVQNTIEKFGFPVFVALLGLVLFSALFRCVTKALGRPTVIRGFAACQAARHCLAVSRNKLPRLRRRFV
jgi:hypothetical protein